MQAERATELLRSAREDAERELERLSTPPGSGPDPAEDRAGNAEELVERGTDDALREMLTVRLEAIGRAQERLREGTYGRSVISGEPIPDARLEIEPWAELNVGEQA